MEALELCFEELLDLHTELRWVLRWVQHSYLIEQRLLPTLNMYGDMSDVGSCRYSLLAGRMPCSSWRNIHCGRARGRGTFLAEALAPAETLAHWGRRRRFLLDYSERVQDCDAGQKDSVPPLRSLV